MTFYDDHGLSGECVYTTFDEDGNYHSYNGQSAIKLKSGTRIWMKNGIIHNEDAPAITLPNGDELWVQDGHLHRIGGPALVSKMGERYAEKGKMKKPSKH